MESEFIINKQDPVLVTGAAGFLGPKIIETLLNYGFEHIRCLVRPSSNLTHLSATLEQVRKHKAEVISGNLLSRRDCSRICDRVSLIYHVAAASEKSFAGTFLNTTITTRNLLEAAAPQPSLRRFVNVSSLAVYSNYRLECRQVLDETCDVERDPVGRNDPYCYGKLRQDEIVCKYGKERGLPYVIVRPGPIYGPRARAPLHARIGLDTFGFYLHLGGSNQIPFTYIDNCAEAVALAGLIKGVEGEVLNIVDDDLPTSREFLRCFKRQAYTFSSLRVPYSLFYLCSWLWETYSAWSRGQIPPAFNRRLCSAYYRGNRYSNEKAKGLLGWKPRVAAAEGMRRHCEFFRKKGRQI
jgi:nucleoside-diphosphate-sugar epimerase